jgi:protein-S-isoprenylcysteine O-methyltransferase Ste14
MRATNWEFKNRAMVFGLIFGCCFGLYSIDHQSGVVALSDVLNARFGMDVDRTARTLFACASGLLVLAAFTRTWASAYLKATTVYASEVKTDSLVADGPYRHVRNPLYFANVLLALGLGAMMSRSGFVVAVAAMLVFCYRLIFREEADLRDTQGEPYRRYESSVPRLWPSLAPRVPASGAPPNWAAGFKAEFWCWGCAAAVIAFAIALNLAAFFVILAISLIVFWFSSSLLARKNPRA